MGHPAPGQTSDSSCNSTVQTHLILLPGILPPNLAIICHYLPIICDIGGVEVEENIYEIDNINNRVKHKYCHRIILASSEKKKTDENIFFYLSRGDLCIARLKGTIITV